MSESHETLRGHRDHETDVVVVGAGAGGAACAYALAKRGLKVVVLEEGHRYRPTQFPAQYGWALNHIYADKGARVVESDGFIPMPSGRGVGGSTLINSAICYRAPDHVLQGWAERFGLDALAPERLAPHYAFVERTIGVTEMHPLQARANNLFIKRGAEKLGLDGAFIHRSAPGCVGCGICQLGCPSGGKGSVDRNFVPMAEELGAAFWTNCRVEEFVRRKGEVVGVRARVTNIETDEEVGTVHLKAKAVVLAAGAVGTPLLLLGAGLTGASGQVGRNLAIHPAVGTYGMVQDAICSWDGVPQGYAVFLDRAAGILLQAYNAPPEVFFACHPWSGPAGAEAWLNLKHLAMCGALISDGSNGVVTVGRRGKARIRYQLSEVDRKKLLRALRTIVRVLFAAGATRVYPGVGLGDDWPTTEAAALAALPDDTPEKQMKLYASHPMGTCRMGTDPKRSVAGPDGGVHGVPGLYIADASLMPTSLGVNPQMTVMSFGLLVGGAVAA